MLLARFSCVVASAALLVVSLSCVNSPSGRDADPTAKALGSSYLESDMEGGDASKPDGLKRGVFYHVTQPADEIKLVEELTEEPRPLSYDEFIFLAKHGYRLKTIYKSLKGEELDATTVLNMAEALPLSPDRMSPEDRGWYVEHWLVTEGASLDVPQTPDAISHIARVLEGVESFYPDIDSNWVMFFSDGSIAVYDENGDYIRGGDNSYNHLPYSIELEGKRVWDVSIAYDYSSEVRYSDGTVVEYSPEGEVIYEKD